ncbi:WXG100 family type VII secretion target [Nocardioides sp.]|uniref:WXG100 family type VII secretion target n=1 Tax=Nocardioides sp. TaxID=35761 RepID=UPI002610DCAB|nr:type VII secretion target [Nocardioides sp.]
MTYEVLVEELRAASGDYRAVAEELGPGSICLTHRTPESLGHVELAAWLGAVAEQCTEASRALHDGAVDLADDLATAATHYESTDDGVAEMFRRPSPFLDPLSPFLTPGQGPVLGPPSPSGSTGPTAPAGGTP